MELKTYCKAEHIYKELDFCRLTIEHIKNRAKENSDLQCYLETMCFTNRILTFPKEIVPEVLEILRKHCEKRLEELEQQFKEL